MNTHLVLPSKHRRFPVLSMRVLGSLQVDQGSRSSIKVRTLESDGRLQLLLLLSLIVRIRTYSVPATESLSHVSGSQQSIDITRFLIKHSDQERPYQIWNMWIPLTIVSQKPKSSRSRKSRLDPKCKGQLARWAIDQVWLSSVRLDYRGLILREVSRLHSRSPSLIAAPFNHDAS